MNEENDINYRVALGHIVPATHSRFMRALIKEFLHINSNNELTIVC